MDGKVEYNTKPFLYTMAIFNNLQRQLNFCLSKLHLVLKNLKQNTTYIFVTVLLPTFIV